MGRLTRREFLQVGGLALGGWGLGRLGLPWPPEGHTYQAAVGLRGRVAASFVYLYSQPTLQSERVGHIRRDVILDILEEIVSPAGPAHNSRWYRLVNGYVHSGRIQRLEGVHTNHGVRSLPDGGQLGEITIPWVQSLQKLRSGRMQPLYRLYYQSVHWVTSLEVGPHGGVWYGLTDELLHVTYCVPAWCVRLVPPEELSPLAPDVPEDQKRIEVSLKEQTLTAFEGERVVLYTTVSTGIPPEWNDAVEDDDDIGTTTETPAGKFRVQTKMPSKHMGDGNLTDDPDAYELLGVPWVSFFYKTGVAFHGTYWHDNFGRRMSHGCVNMRNVEAKWLYRWATPVAKANEWNTRGLGTQVAVTGGEA